jgi:hypothetical protein
MQTRPRPWLDHAQKAQGCQQRIGQGVVKEQSGVVSIAEREPRKRAKALGNEEERPENEQSAKSRGKWGAEPRGLPAKHHHDPERQADFRRTYFGTRDAELSRCREHQAAGEDHVDEQRASHLECCLAVRRHRVHTVRPELVSCPMLF